MIESKRFFIILFAFGSVFITLWF